LYHDLIVDGYGFPDITAGVRGSTGMFGDADIGLVHLIRTPSGFPEDGSSDMGNGFTIRDDGGIDFKWLSKS